MESYLYCSGSGHVFLMIFSALAFSHLILSRSTVRFLPGFEGPLPFELETGYVGVDRSEDVQLFYYFVKSESNPKEDPLVLWLTGGPGCSSFNGFAFEIGPLSFDATKNDGSFPTLVWNPYSWTKLANIIFLDLPVGTGFSYGRTTAASQSSDSQACHQAYEFLKKWLIDHLEFESNPIYIGGDSYSGITVPAVVQLISDGIETNSVPHINLKSLQRNCRGKYFHADSRSAECLQDVDAYEECTDGFSPNNVLDPLCELASPRPSKFDSRKRYSLDKITEFIDSEASPCPDRRTITYQRCHVWINDERVQKALHVREGSVALWMRCNIKDLNYTITGMNSFPNHVYLSNKGYRSLVYSGDHDLVVPFLATQAWIRSLNYSIVDDWRQWIVEGQVAGYTRRYANDMTFATVKGGGHTAPEYNPRECYAMFERWISHQRL